MWPTIRWFQCNLTEALQLALIWRHFTNYHGRRTRIMGSMGCIVGDEEVLTVANFSTDEVTEWLTKDHSTVPGHGGGDWGLMRDFLRAVENRDESLLTSTLEASMDSHRMGFAAERAGSTTKPLHFKLFRLPPFGRDVKSFNNEELGRCIRKHDYESFCGYGSYKLMKSQTQIWNHKQHCSPCDEGCTALVDSGYNHGWNGSCVQQHRPSQITKLIAKNKLKLAATKRTNPMPTQPRTLSPPSYFLKMEI